LSNLLKVGTTISKEERVIDYNDTIRDKVETARKQAERFASEGGFVSGLDVDFVEQIEGFGEDLEEAAAVEDESVLEDAQQQATEIIEEANSKADEIVAQAESHAANILENAKKDGYQAGMIRVEQEYTQKQQELEQKYQDMRDNLQSEYDDLKQRMEPELVEALLEVFSKVTHTIAEDNKDIVLHLINDVMKNSDNSHEYTIKVSPEDYDFVLNNQGKIYCAMANEVTIDIVQDSTLKQNECVIETESGVFDCSLDVEMNNLIKDIKLLSCV
jgi:flagellar assembly protein FliH